MSGEGENLMAVHERQKMAAKEPGRTCHQYPHADPSRVIRRAGRALRSSPRSRFLQPRLDLRFVQFAPLDELFQAIRQRHACDKLDLVGGSLRRAYAVAYQ